VEVRGPRWVSVRRQQYLDVGNQDRPAETYEAVDLRVGEACVACELAVLTLCRMLNLAGMSVSTIEFATTAGRNLDLLLTDSVLRYALVNTAIFVVASVAAETVLGLALVQHDDPPVRLTSKLRATES
jgi:ABC-type sugar transport system permease subunit